VRAVASSDCHNGDRRDYEQDAEQALSSRLLPVPGLGLAKNDLLSVSE